MSGRQPNHTSLVVGVALMLQPNSVVASMPAPNRENGWLPTTAGNASAQRSFGDGGSTHRSAAICTHTLSQPVSQHSGSAAHTCTQQDASEQEMPLWGVKQESVEAPHKVPQRASIDMVRR